MAEARQRVSELAENGWIGARNRSDRWSRRWHRLRQLATSRSSSLSIARTSTSVGSPTPSARQWRRREPLRSPRNAHAPRPIDAAQAQPERCAVPLAFGVKDGDFVRLPVDQPELRGRALAADDRG